MGDQENLLRAEAALCGVEQRATEALLHELHVHQPAAKHAPIGTPLPNPLAKVITSGLIAVC